MSPDLIIPWAADLFVKSSLVVILAGLFLAIWRKASAAQRSFVWCLAFALIAVLPATRVVAPHWALWFSETPAPIAHSVPPLPTGVKLASSGGTEIALSPRSWSTLDAMSIALGIWVTGICLLLSYRAVGSVLLWQRTRASLFADDPALLALATSIGTEFGITRPVEIRLSADCPVPMTWGTFRPVIMLPGAVAEWPSGWIESALRHEMGHVLSYDHLKRLLVFLICTAYWPNPLVWIAARQLQLAQEEASDNLVLGNGISPADYATQLIEVIRAAAERARFPIPVVTMARPSTLEGRLSAILDDSRNRQSASRTMLAMGTVLAIVVGCAFGAVQLRAADTPSSEISGPSVVASAPTKSHDETPEPLTVRTFLAPPTLFQLGTAPPSTPTVDVKDQLVNRGILFGEGATATLNPKSGKIIVRNTATQLDLLAKLIEDLDPKTQSHFTEVKLETTQLNVNFNNADISVVLDFLTKKSVELDPGKKGIKFVLNLPDKSKPVKPSNGYTIHRAVSITLDNCPLKDVLDYIMEQTNLKWSIEGDTVYFKP